MGIDHEHFPQIELTFDENNQPSGSYIPDFSCGETWIDEVVELIRQGNIDEAKRVVVLEVNDQVKDAVMNSFHPLLSYITDSKDARFAADVAAYSSKLRVRDGWTGSTLAQKYGLSRTSARFHVEKFCAMFGLPVPDERKDNKNSTNNRRNEHLDESE
jgi:hypothetical protein